MENSDAVKTVDYRGKKIVIQYDIDPRSPREDDNIGVMHCAHRLYELGDVQHNSFESIREAEQECLKKGDIVLPLYLYDHSGITISTTPFSCPWDSGQVGFIVISRKRMMESFGKKVFNKKLKDKAAEIAEGEVKAYDQYLRGEIYGYVTDDDSCWGYDDIDAAIEAAKEVIDSIVCVK